MEPTIAVTTPIASPAFSPTAIGVFPLLCRSRQLI